VCAVDWNGIFVNVLVVHLPGMVFQRTRRSFTSIFGDFLVNAFSRPFVQLNYLKGIILKDSNNCVSHVGLYSFCIFSILCCSKEDDKLPEAWSFRPSCGWVSPFLLPSPLTWEWRQVKFSTCYLHCWRSLVLRTKQQVSRCRTLFSKIYLFWSP
jgi:hypothetical protein